MREFLRPAVLALVLLAAGCGETKDDRGIRYMPDMYRSTALKSQEAFVVVERQQGAEGEEPVLVEHHVPAMQPPADGTIPRDFAPYTVPATPEGLELAKTIENPIAPTPDVLRLGRVKYDIYCAVCHGKDGSGKTGYVTQSARGVIGVLPISGQGTADRPDGEIFHIITHGRNRMPDYTAQLLPDERWAVVHYLRALQRATLASGEERQRIEQAQTRETEGRFAPPPAAVPEYEQRMWPAKITEEKR